MDLLVQGMHVIYIFENYFVILHIADKRNNQFKIPKTKQKSLWRLKKNNNYEKCLPIIGGVLTSVNVISNKSSNSKLYHLLATFQDELISLFHRVLMRHYCTRSYLPLLVPYQEPLVDWGLLSQRKKTLELAQELSSCAPKLEMRQPWTSRCIWTGSSWCRLQWCKIRQWRTESKTKEERIDLINPAP